jgi:hypothetical protein
MTQAAPRLGASVSVGALEATICASSSVVWANSSNVEKIGVPVTGVDVGEGVMGVNVGP